MKSCLNVFNLSVNVLLMVAERASPISFALFLVVLRDSLLEILEKTLVPGHLD